MLDFRATHNSGHRPELGGVCMTMTKRLPRYLDDHQDLAPPTSKDSSPCTASPHKYIYWYIVIFILTWERFYIFARVHHDISSTTRASSPGVTIVSPGTNGGPSPGEATHLHLGSVLHLAHVTQYDLSYRPYQLARVANKRVEIAVHGYSVHT